MPFFILGAVPFVFLQSGDPIRMARHNHGNVDEDLVGESCPNRFEPCMEGTSQVFLLDVIEGAESEPIEYLKRLRREERERYEYQQALVASELRSLKAQLRPRFLFNTFHRIATLVDGDSKNAHAVIIRLSDLFRTALDSASADLISLQDEPKFVRAYLDLEKMRFGRRLQIEWLVAPATKWAVGTADDPSTVNRERNRAWRFLCSRRRMGRCGRESTRRNSRNPGAQQRCGTSSSGTGVGLRNMRLA
jgi:hypothetical protein